jgi:3-hydroxymyristoyl/3-hydroxydecanoyl-(acyl carrier protein) dehydratase
VLIADARKTTRLTPGLLLFLKFLTLSKRNYCGVRRGRLEVAQQLIRSGTQ